MHKVVELAKTDHSQELIKQVQDLTDERTKAQVDLELSQYLCKKQGEDLKIAQNEVQSLQKSMVSEKDCRETTCLRK